MSKQLPGPRRVVTAHRDDGTAIVKSDDILILNEVAPNLKAGTVWVTESVPTKDNNLNIDGARRPVTGDYNLVSPNGTHCNVTDLAPGAWTSWHRASSLDHNILISGTVVLKIEDGERTLRPGDIVIQRGTMHAWYNPGPEWARWACVLVDAKPAIVNGRPLEAEDLGQP